MVFALNYSEFYEVKDFPTAYEMWNKPKKIYVGDDNVRRARVTILR